MTYRDLRRHGDARGQDFYETALRYAQTLWMRGLPAQAILQINRALSSELPCFPINPGDSGHCISPYRALAWMLSRSGDDGFLGNPVRHFQHLATRMSGPRSEIRRWRAWGCFHLAESLLAGARYPRDEVQAEKESIVFPCLNEVVGKIRDGGWTGETDELLAALDGG